MLFLTIDAEHMKDILQESTVYSYDDEGRLNVRTAKINGDRIEWRTKPKVVTGFECATVLHYHKAPEPQVNP